MTIRDLPRPIRALLSITLPSDWREDIARDLEEAWSRRVDSGGRIVGLMWLTSQALVFSIRFAPSRAFEILGRATSSSFSGRNGSSMDFDFPAV